MAGAVKIAILANAAQAKAEMDSVVKSAGGMSSKLKGGVAVAAAAAGVALASMATSAIAGARESAEINRVLQSQLKGMGAEAQKAFSGATKFAADFGTQIGKDDDDILKVVNKLSTFPAAFGKGTLGAEGMRRATQAAFDLEAAGVGSAESNIIGLGKALDNPIKGMTALSKSGVSFTAEQQAQIKNYMEQGRLADAQKVLLAGIETNAKGAATAQADGLTRAKVALDGMAEGIASKLLPYLDKFGNWFTTVGIPKIEQFGAWFGTNVVPVIGQAFEIAKTAVAGFVAVLSNPAVQAFGAAILTIVAAIKVYQVVMTAIRVVTMAWAAAQAALNVVMALNPIGLVVLAILALVAAFVIAYRQSETFRRIVSTAFAGVKTAVSTVVTWIRSNWPLLLAILTGPIGLAVAAIIRHKDTILAAFKALPGQIKGVFSGAGSFLADAGRRVIQGFIDAVQGAFGRVRDTLSRLTGLLPSWKGPKSLDLKILAKPGQWVMQGFQRSLEAGYADVSNSLGTFTSGLGGTVNAGQVTVAGAPAVTAAGGAVVIDMSKAPSGGLDRVFWQWFRETARANGLTVVGAA